VLSLVEAAAFLKLPKKTVENLAAGGELPGRKIGKEWRFLRSAIEDWLQPQLAYRGPSDAQLGALIGDPTFDEFMDRVTSYRKPAAVHRS
jgi:excisionase family DNA binding protein